MSGEGGLFGMPLRVDPDLPEGVFEIMQADGIRRRFEFVEPADAKGLEELKVARRRDTVTLCATAGHLPTGARRMAAGSVAVLSVDCECGEVVWVPLVRPDQLGSLVQP